MTTWRDKKGRFKACRVRSFDYNDPITVMSGCGGEISNMMRRKDLEEGCPWCLEELMENASEPDVLARWRS